MNLKQAVKMAFKSIVSNKMRSILTMLGIIIGVGAVVIMVSVIQGQNARQMEYYTSQGQNTISVYAYNWNGRDVSQDIYTYCQGMTGLVAAVTPNINMYKEVTVKYGSKTYSTYGNDWRVNPNVIMSNDQYALCNNYTLAVGRDMSYLDIQNDNNVCVLGGLIAKNLFDFVSPVDKFITLNGTPFLVIGVYQEKNVDNWPEWDNIIVIPEGYNRTMNGNERVESYTVKAVDATVADETVTRLSGYLSGLIPQNSGYYNVRSNNASLESMDEMLLMQSLVLGGIAGISLLVGGIGIMNIMLVTVTERTREIGIRKAIGAERKSIITQFLIESCMICGMGGIIGILIGYLGTMIASKIMFQMILYPNTSITIGAFLFSVVLGIGFGIYPAAKASRLQPVEALRSE